MDGAGKVVKEEDKAMHVPPASLEKPLSMKDFFDYDDGGDGIISESKPTGSTEVPGVVSPLNFDFKLHVGQTMPWTDSRAGGRAGGQFLRKQRSMGEDEMGKLLDMGYNAVLVK